MGIEPDHALCDDMDEEEQEEMGEQELELFKFPNVFRHVLLEVMARAVSAGCGVPVERQFENAGILLRE